MGNKYYLCITPERAAKTRMIQNAVAGSFPGSSMTLDDPPPGEPFVCWGHLWNSARIVPPAWEAGTPFYFIDNGYLEPANGTAKGYYAVTYRSFSPMLLDDPDMSRLPVTMKDWRDPATNSQGHILVCVPGPGFGKMFGWNIEAWVKGIGDRLRQMTDRKVVIRNKSSSVPLVVDMAGASVVVTHSSKAAVAAVREGIPCIVEPLSCCAPVCGSNLNELEKPPMPDRSKWWASMMCQQFTLDELRRGAAKYWLDIAAQQGEREMKPGLPPNSLLLEPPRMRRAKKEVLEQ